MAENGIEAVVAENVGYEDITPILEGPRRGRRDLIICHASGYQTVCPEFAAEMMSRSWLSRTQALWLHVGLLNIETQAQEVAYLAGILNGKTTRRNRWGGCFGRAADLELHDGRFRRGPQSRQSGR